jgi:hypothetical protein
MGFKEQIKNAVLEYLSPEAYRDRLSKSADMVTKDQVKRDPKRTPIKGNLQAGREIDALADTRSARVSKVERGRRGGAGPLGKPTKLSKRGFDDDRAVGPNKSRPATLRLGRTLDIGEQFKNAVLNYLDENGARAQNFSGGRAENARAQKHLVKRRGAGALLGAGNTAGAHERMKADQLAAVKRHGEYGVAGVGDKAGAQSRFIRDTTKASDRAAITQPR